MESGIGDNRRVVVVFLIFLKCLRSLLLVISNSGYCCSKWNGRFCLNLDRDVFIGLFNLVSCRIIVDRRCSAVHRGVSHDDRFVIEVSEIRSEMVIQAPRHKI